MHTDQFTATGPPFSGSGFPNTGFSTIPPSPKWIAALNWIRRFLGLRQITEVNFEYGVNVQGNRCGVYGESVRASSLRESMAEGVGVHGSGEIFGVYGNARGIAGVFGQHSRSGTGVLGAAMKGGAGVVGASVKDILNPMGTFESIPDPANGNGTGVLGTSGMGAGVRGSSREGDGGHFNSRSGVGVFGESDEGTGVLGKSGGDRGGVFESGQNVAQINLVPQQQNTGDPELPKVGRVGDLLLIRNTVAGHLKSDQCSLWLCVPSAATLIGVAAWQEVTLGRRVNGSL